MHYVQLSKGSVGWFIPLACGPCSPELSNSFSDMTSKSKLFTFKPGGYTGATLTLPPYPTLTMGQQSER